MSLVHLSDQNVLFAVEQWARRHPTRTIGDGPRTVHIADLDLNAIAEDQRIELK
jgi:hypothetical protein